MGEDGRSTRWDRHREQQRRRIVDAAIDLIEAGDPTPSLVDVGRRAALARSVVYRHFADKAELDAAVHAQVLEDLRHDVSAHVRLHGSLRESVADALGAYISWAAAHPALHARDDDAAVQGIVRRALDTIAGQVADVAVAAFSAAGASVSEADRMTTAPLAYGLVSGVFAVVSKWVHQGAEVPSADRLVDLLTEMVVAMTTTRLAAYGVTLDPDAPLTDLLAP